MTTKTPRAKADRIFERLRDMYPDARIELTFSNALELTVATVLSAQCTDKKVNEVTATLFRKYHTPKDYLNVTEEELQADIKPTGFYKQKARSLRAIMRALVDIYDNEVPADIESLTALPGIGRKTANVILGNAFGIPGIVVDTHVKRVSARLGLTRNSAPEKIEQDLMAVVPRQDWTKASHLLIFHGRYTCKARSPLCDQCPLTSLCDFYQTSPEA